MKRLVKRVALPAAAIAIAGFGMGAAAYAAVSDVTTPVGGPYHVCVDEHTHDLTKIWGHSANASCPQGQLLYKWDVTGPQGPRGIEGPRGIQGPRGIEGPPGINAPTWRSEVDNGTEFSLSTGPLGDTSAPSPGYADAGVVVDAGKTDNLTDSSFHYDVTSTASLYENVWIGNGPQASTPGIYQLSNVDFCYANLNFDGTGAITGFFMNSGCGANSGQTLSLADLKAAYPGFEAYVWVGVASFSGPASTTVNSVDGQAVHATANIAQNGDVMVPTVTPIS